MKALTQNEQDALDALRAKGSLVVGLRQSRTAMAKHGLRQGDVLPSVARGLESRRLVTLHRPDKRGPSHVILAAQTMGAAMDYEEWRRKALIYDVWAGQTLIGQVAAINELEADTEARAFWPKRRSIDVVLARPLYEVKP